MARRVGRVLLWLLVLDLGIAFGAGIYEARVVIPHWATTSPAMWPNTGLLFWVYVTTVPLTLPAVGNAIAAWLGQGPRRAWWLSAVAIVVLERIATFAYFIPTMVRLMGAEALPGRTSRRPSRSGSSSTAAGTRSRWPPGSPR